MLSVLSLWLTTRRCFSTLCLLGAFSLVPFWSSRQLMGILEVVGDSGVAPYR